MLPSVSRSMHYCVYRKLCNVAQIARYKLLTPLTDYQFGGGIRYSEKTTELVIAALFAAFHDLLAIRQRGRGCQWGIWLAEMSETSNLQSRLATKDWPHLRSPRRLLRPAFHSHILSQTTDSQKLQGYLVSLRCLCQITGCFMSLILTLISFNSIPKKDKIEKLWM